VTTVSRTLLDLASVLDRDRLAQAIQRAEARQLTDPVGLRALLERYPGRRGTAVLREVLANRRLGLDVARSDLEIDFQTFLRSIASGAARASSSSSTAARTTPVATRPKPTGRATAA
jgi:hypothetical protein